MAHEVTEDERAFARQVIRNTCDADRFSRGNQYARRYLSVRRVLEWAEVAREDEKAAVLSAE